MFQFLYEIDHVFAHWGPLNAVDKSRTLQTRIFRFNLFNDLFAKRTHFRWTCYHDVLIAFVPTNRNRKWKIKLTCSEVVRWLNRADSGHLLAGNGIECTSFICNICVQVSPTFHQVECILGTLFVHLFQTARFLGEFVADLSDVDRLKWTKNVALIDDCALICLCLRRYYL